MTRTRVGRIRREGFEIYTDRAQMCRGKFTKSLFTDVSVGDKSRTETGSGGKPQSVLYAFK